MIILHFFFFFNDTATTEIYTTTDTLSLHDALPIYRRGRLRVVVAGRDVDGAALGIDDRSEEHTSELQSPVVISYAVFCLKKKMVLSNNAHTGGTCFGDSGGPNFIGTSNVISCVTSFGKNSTCAGTGFFFY